MWDLIEGARKWLSGGAKGEFQRRMREQCTRARLRPDSADDSSAVFMLPSHDGEGIGCGVVLIGDEVIFTAMSTIKFPPRRIPPALLEACAERSIDLGNAQWGEHHAARYSKLKINCRCPLADFQGGMLTSALSYLHGEVERLDAALRERGFGG